MSRGEHSNAGKGALIGGGIGIGLGLLMVIASASEDSGGWAEPTAGEYVLSVVIIGGLGSGVGALLGALSRMERWETVPLERVSATARRSPGVRLGLSLKL